MSTIPLIESEDDMNDSIVIHDEVENIKIDFSVLRIAESTDLYGDLAEIEKNDKQLPFKPCTYDDIETEIINTACEEEKSMFEVVTRLREHVERAVAYTDNHKMHIKRSIIGKIQAKQLKPERYNIVYGFINNFLK